MLQLRHCPTLQLLVMSSHCLQQLPVMVLELPRLLLRGQPHWAAVPVRRWSRAGLLASLAVVGVALGVPWAAGRARGGP